MIELLGERALSQRPLQNAVAQARFQLPEQCENIGERNRSALFNPLLEVRKGAHEVRDVQNIPFFTVEETAKLLRVKRRTLDNLRWKAEGPPWRRHGGRIVYHRDSRHLPNRSPTSQNCQVRQLQLSTTRWVPLTWLAEGRIHRHE